MPSEKEKVDAMLRKANLDQLVSYMQSLSTAGREIILEGLSRQLTDARKKELIAQLKTSAIATDAKVKSWIKSNVTDMYITGAQTAQSNLYKATKHKIPNINITYKVLVSGEGSPHVKAVNLLLSDAYLDFGTTMTGYVRGAEKILNNALRGQLREQIALGRLDGQGVRDVQKTISQELKDKGFTVLVDKGGNSWELERYSEMLARTHLIRANNEGSINRMQDYDIDIVQIDSHGAKDRICAEQEGKIYSLSGKSENYPRIEKYPPFHPNCAHTVLPRPDLT